MTGVNEKGLTPRQHSVPQGWICINTKRKLPRWDRSSRSHMLVSPSDSTLTQGQPIAALDLKCRGLVRQTEEYQF